MLDHQVFLGFVCKWWGLEHQSFKPHSSNETLSSPQRCWERIEVLLAATLGASKNKYWFAMNRTEKTTKSLRLRVSEMYIYNISLLATFKKLLKIARNIANPIENTPGPSYTPHQIMEQDQKAHQTPWKPMKNPKQTKNYTNSTDTKSHPNIFTSTNPLCSRTAAKASRMSRETPLRRAMATVFRRRGLPQQRSWEQLVNQLAT